MRTDPRYMTCRGPAVVKAAADQAARHASTTSTTKVVGMGSCGLDYLAAVARFPQPDDKIRTERLETQGGGNCANALTAASRLGLEAHLVSQIGDDGIGEQIIAELEGDGVQTAHVLRAEGSPSPFTYIIVDREGSTRTCIHTPGAPYTPDQLSPERIPQILGDSTQLVYFDGRLTEAALLLARAARAAGIPVLVEAERLRPNLDALLGEADYVCMSTHFPKDWTGEACLGDALVSSLQRLPRVRWLVATLGKRGSVLIQRCHPSECDSESKGVVLEGLVAQLFGELGGGAGAPGSATAPGGAVVRASRVLAAGQAHRLLLQRGEAHDPNIATAAASAARNAATDNADSANASSYRISNDMQMSSFDEQPAGDTGVYGRVTVASAADLPQDAVVDTTGAGDAFLGSMLYALCHDMPAERALRLAAVVAACNCTGLGARGGLPWRDAVSAELL
ncbi:hypothetical protein WJX72_007184 [[Myrmecia] bisecta]|uniref:Carbohydrate kinase PfkB domain-containing protein n=1 Tax=[Myrmecia] bisecta TaxID=41462 RepID=A0AAW1PU24_9CHLO